MAQLAKALAGKPESDAQAHRMEGETNTSELYSDRHMTTVACVQPLPTKMRYNNNNN